MSDYFNTLNFPLSINGLGPGGPSSATPFMGFPPDSLAIDCQVASSPTILTSPLPEDSVSSASLRCQSPPPAARPDADEGFQLPESRGAGDEGAGLVAVGDGVDEAFDGGAHQVGADPLLPLRAQDGHELAVHVPRLVLALQQTVSEAAGGLPTGDAPQGQVRRQGAVSGHPVECDVGLEALSFRLERGPIDAAPRG